MAGGTRFLSGTFSDLRKSFDTEVTDADTEGPHNFCNGKTEDSTEGGESMDAAGAEGASEEGDLRSAAIERGAVGGRRICGGSEVKTGDSTGVAVFAIPC